MRPRNNIDNSTLAIGVLGQSEWDLLWWSLCDSGLVGEGPHSSDAATLNSSKF